jgi:hypothetical protein
MYPPPNVTFGWQRDKLFMGYLFVGVYCLVSGFFFWPDLPYRCTPPPPSQVDNRRRPNPQPVKRVVIPELMDKPLLTQV